MVIHFLLCSRTLLPCTHIPNWENNHGRDWHAPKYLSAWSGIPIENFFLKTLLF